MGHYFLDIECLQYSTNTNVATEHSVPADIATPESDTVLCSNNLQLTQNSPSMMQPHYHFNHH